MNLSSSKMLNTSILIDKVVSTNNDRVADLGCGILVI